ncbi:MAG: alpha/beta hydrolase [Spirochaetes bacterium]|jgi:triacylglycerol lipase|nr:alpha/beta hydrolase [Spirochaetota bacterium]
MKRLLLAIILALAIPFAVFAGGDSSPCKTVYPIVLAHGMGATDNMLGFINYWWGTESALEGKGADVYITKVNCMDTTQNKAAAFKTQFLQILAATGKAKANIIGHSHGTIYTRYAITNLGLGTKAASHTSLCGPHRGSAVADVILGLAGDTGGWLIGATLDVVYAFIMGDAHPQSYANGVCVTRPYMNNTFNPNCPNKSGVYYQSYATRITLIASNDMVLTPTYWLLNFYEGQNDGLVSVTSAKWGTFRGVQEGTWILGGVSHINAIGHFFGVTPGFSSTDWITGIVGDLKSKGY